MKEQERHLEGIGEMDYDYLNDILFFKVKDREYEKSKSSRRLLKPYPPLFH